MKSLKETFELLEKKKQKKDQFAWFRFEHANTTKLVDALETKGYDIVGANEGEILIASLNEKVAKKIQDIIWEFNDGAWCEYKMATYDEVEYLL